MSHTYANLRARVTPSDESRRCAERIPLIHTVRDPAEHDKILKILRSGHLGGQQTMPRPRTSTANEALGIPDGTVFFYAGRAFPHEVEAALILLFGGVSDGSNALDDHIQGGATPFDTGGLMHDRPERRLKLPGKAGDLDAVARTPKEYFRAHNMRNLTEWREYFGLFLQEFFASARGYWDSVPSKDIDGVSFSSGDDWRNWTFEVRSEATSVPMEFVGLLFADGDTASRLLADVQTNPRLAPILMKRLKLSSRPRVAAEAEAQRAATE